MDYMFDDSECSSGCESGWTLYLENSFMSTYDGSNGAFVKTKGALFYEEKSEKEEEDLSMVSDASSGPPHFQEDEDYGNNNHNGCLYNGPIGTALPRNRGKRQKVKENLRRNAQEQASLLDDTASSPIFDFSNSNLSLANNRASVDDVLDFSQGYSATHFKGRSAYQGEYDFFQSSISGNQFQKNQWLERKRWG